MYSASSFRRIKEEQSGRSMVEMLGVLAIIGVLSVGGISGYSKAMAKFKASKAMDQLSMLVANIRTAFSTMSNYGDLSNVNAKKYAIASRDMWSGSASASGLVNAFGGKLELAAYKYNGITAAGFAIAYSGLNNEACIQLLTADWGTAGLAAIKVNGSGEGSITTTADAPDGDDSSVFVAANMPVQLSEAYTACGSTGNNKSIVWYYY